MRLHELEKLKNEVFDRQHVLKRIYLLSGGRSLYDYANSWQAAPSAAGPEFFSVMEKSFGRLYGKAVAQAAARQIRDTGLVSTIDHHGIFGHPFFLNSNLVFALKSGLEFLPVFSTSGVSLNNSSWPGSLLLTDNKRGVSVRHSFFKDSLKTRTVFGTGPIKESGIDGVLRQLQHEDFLTKEQKQELAALIVEMFADGRVKGRTNFSDQAAIVSWMLWQRLFPQAPQLLYLPLEELAGDVIVRLILPDPRHILSRLMFTKEGLDMLERRFTGVRGAFGPGRGSFLFWKVDESGRRFAVTRQELEARFRLDPEAVASAIEARKIYPTSLLCFLTLLYYQVVCLGGFNQTGWLTEIKSRFFLLLEELGEKEQGRAVGAIPTDNFAETTLAFSYRHGKLSKPSALDLYINKADFNEFRHLARNITLAQSLESELPEIYKIVVPAGERKGGLSRITAVQIAEANGLTRMLELL